MSKVTYKSKILQYAPANHRVSDRESAHQTSIGWDSDRSSNRPCVIPYHPRLAAMLLGNVYAAIFLQQVYHRYRSKGDKPFYKFLAPCSSEYYRKGDSWIEELSFTYSQLNRAIGTVATKISSTRKKAGANKSQLLSINRIEMSANGKALNSSALVLYWTNRDRRTWWIVNLPLFISLSQAANLSNPQNADQLIDEPSISPIGNPAIRFPHAEIINKDKSIDESQNQFSVLENHSLITAINPAHRGDALNQYTRVVEKACTATLNLCSSEMAEKILSAARSLQAAGHSLEQIALVGHWWKDHFWKGQRGTPPRPNDLLDMYGAAESFYTTGEASDCCRVFIEQWRSNNELESERV